MNSYTTEIQKQLDDKRKELKCTLCGQHPLMIEVAGKGLQTGDKCHRRIGGNVCGGIYRKASQRGKKKK